MRSTAGQVISCQATRSEQMHMEEGQIECSPLSKLPDDTLTLIRERLPTIVDQIRFRLYFRGWRLDKIPQYERNIPWLLGRYLHVNNNGAWTQHFLFYFPSADKQFQEEQEYFRGVICASKYGWLLLQQSEKLFFYSPLSRKQIELPDMELNFNLSTFSSSPTSPGCICFTIQSSRSSDKISISTCSRGDTKWRTITMAGFEKAVAVEDVVYWNGDFYCGFTGGRLGKFCIARSLLECA